jgi:hypothetical protein
VKTVKPTTKLHSVASAVRGMRRVDYVRMVEDTQPRFFVVGVGHRVPVEREISPAVARVLLDEVPCRHEWRRAGTPTV